MISAEIDQHSLAARIFDVLLVRTALLLALCVASPVVYAQSCAPDAPRVDSGEGFTPFGEHEQALARAGNARHAWEWALGPDTESRHKVRGNLDWVSGRVYHWTLLNSGNGREALTIRDRGRVVLRLAYPSRMNAGNSLELRISTNPSIDPHTTIAATLTKLNGHAVSGSLFRTGSRKHSEQALYYYFPEMEQGFTAEGTVSLTYGRKRPTGSRVEFTVRAGTIPCAPPANSPPTVSITSPSANSTFRAPATIMVSANAEDTDGTVAQVVFYANGNLVGTATSSPFEVQLADVQAGTYDLTAVATDNNGLRATSAAVSIAVNATQALYFIHVDHLNTPRLIANSAGASIWQWDQQEPFGGDVIDTNRSESNPLAMSLRFAGQQHDTETMLHYNYFRQYDPSLGRYLESDPIGLRGRSLNTYAYVNSNSLTFIDSLGLEAEVCARPFYPVPVPLARHCFIRFNQDDRDTSSYDTQGTHSDPAPKWWPRTCKATSGPDNDECIKREMVKCKGEDYDFTANNCCHCAERALKACGLLLPAREWPNWPANPGPLFNEKDTSR